MGVRTSAGSPGSEPSSTECKAQAGHAVGEFAADGQASLEKLRPNGQVEPVRPCRRARGGGAAGVGGALSIGTTASGHSGGAGTLGVQKCIAGMLAQNRGVPQLESVWLSGQVGVQWFRERFVKTIKYECLNHFVICGERHLRHLIKEFVEPTMTERFHQGIGGQLIRNVGPTNDNGADGKVACRSRLGGLLNTYHREAA
jgi:hypothetical protein